MNPNSAKPDALRVRQQLAGSHRDRVLDLFRRADAGRLVDSERRAWPDLTDFELAACLSDEIGEDVLRTTVIPARNALVKEGLVEKARKRRCRFRPSGQDVWGWRLSRAGDAPTEANGPSPLRLVTGSGCPVAPGDRIRVTEPIERPSGRKVRRGRYLVLDVDGGRVKIATALDCSGLPKMYHPPSPEERAAGAEVPIAAQLAEVWLEPGTYTHYAGNATDPATIPDHPALAHP